MKHVTTFVLATLAPAFSQAVWTQQQSPFAGRLSALTWTGSQLVAVGDSGAILTSPDGMSWTRQTSGSNANLKGVAWGNGQLVAVGANVGAMLTSPDGTQWTRQFQSSYPTWNSVVYTGRQWVAVGQFDAMTSPDAIDWTPRVQGASGLNCVVWTGSLLVALGNSGATVTSTDGIAWTPAVLNTQRTVRGAVWTGKQILAVGLGDSTWTSPDGLAWSPRSTEGVSGLNAIAWADSQTVAVGNGFALSSRDGEHWAVWSTGGPHNLLAVAWTGKQWVAVGDRGIILTAPQEMRPPDSIFAPTQILSPCERQQGFRLLFDGTWASFRGNFATWKPGTDSNADLDTHYQLCAAESSICTGGAASDIRSREKYGDFDLRLEYRNNGSNGIYYKALTRGWAAWMTGVYMAVNDSYTGSPDQGAGAVYDVFPPMPNTYRKFSTGLWNQVRIVAKGDSVEHWMNGVKVLGYRFWNDRWKTAVASSKWSGSADHAQWLPGCQCYIPVGYIGFEGDWAGQWHLRNIRIAADPAFVRFGQADTTRCIVATHPSRPEKAHGLLLEQFANGLRVRLSSGSTLQVEIRGLDGKKALIGVENQGATALIHTWNHSGIYFLRATSATGALFSRMICLP